MQFGSKSGCGATLGMTHVKTFPTLYLDFPESNSRRDCAICVWIRMRRNPWHDSCPDLPDLMFRHSRWNSRRDYAIWVWIRMRRDPRSDHGWYDATFATKADKARLFIPRRGRREFRNQGGYSVVFQTEANMAQFFRPTQVLDSWFDWHCRTESNLCRKLRRSPIWVESVKLEPFLNEPVET